MSIDESNRIEFESTAPIITFDTHDFDEIAGRYGAHYDGIIFNPEMDKDATSALKQQVESWKHEGASVVFTSGVYDVLHADHKGYLLHTKLAGAQIHFATKYTEDSNRTPWDSLTREQKKDLSDSFLRNEELKLVVSVDGDKSVSFRKGSKQEKGNSARPITGWLTRARSVADVTVPVSNNDGLVRIPVANAVSIHGPEDFESGDPHASIISLAGLIQPDVWTIFEESKDITETVPYIPELGSIALRCIRMGGDSRYFTDSILGKFSTTAIVDRIRGTE